MRDAIQIIWNTLQNSGILEPGREELAEVPTLMSSRKYSFEAFRANLLYATEAEHIHQEVGGRLLNLGVGIEALMRKIALKHS
ncbi:hypothetical protein KSF_001760 [Reticulibacter mediterranei]|uniref:Uncharacterized protein n=1 Tax=Reticulibacter mediterranei TaxID=2778369 RepID=A0A8J3MZ70_9CHLR|nr:hypothetical protein [Reticulibacter mediterranei]GHO90128.1 hypothetical protein KSF_001760 [Reticulibacter mediterranei]